MCPPYVLLFLWLANIILSCQHFVVASTIAAWYFTRHKTHMSAPVMRSMQLLVGYHLGSVIYGSLALVVADPLRAIISGTRLVWHDNTQAGASATRLVRPCCSCLDRFLMHLNRKAYIVMAMHGLSFRTSGRRVLRLLDRHCQQVAKLDTVSGFVLFLAKFNVALLAVFSGLWIIKENQTTVYVWAPLIAAGCIAYYIADSCISLYEVAVDTLFLCFSEDCEKNNGVTKPYFVTDSLRAFMHDSKNELPDIGSTRVTS
ncbi:choline transporter-like protein 1 [Dermacentor silvarum]|uniref:choline transporter-like protein 1 n=1 Tax=Dermacentor silvarum TaxID=543639 RepID=UPI0021019FB3|nr:choline transporter-like protein 1 [Dermacentor silvarum]